MEEIIKIRDMLISGEINTDEAWKLIKELPNPWKTSYWKNKRKLLIKDHCDVCGSNIGTMVLQHTKQPMKYSLIYKSLLDTLAMQLVEAKPKTNEWVTEFIEKRNEIYKSFSDDIKKQALIISLNESIEYLEFKHTKTCCKRCAAIEDRIVPEYVLCKICGEKYHNPIYEMCYICFGKTEKGRAFFISSQTENDEQCFG